MGVYARIIGKLEKSEEYLTKALGIYNECEKTGLAFSVELRLAVTKQWLGQYGKADTCFTAAIKKLEGKSGVNSQKLLDYAAEHYGKSLYEQKRYEGALEYFLKSHEMKMILGDMQGMTQMQGFIDTTNQQL